MVKNKLYVQGVSKIDEIVSLAYTYVYAHIDRSNENFFETCFDVQHFGLFNQLLEYYL
jgi:hypothetical protein